MKLSDGTIVSSPIKLLTRVRGVYEKKKGETKQELVGAYFVFNGNKLYYDDPDEAQKIREEIAEKVAEAEMVKKTLPEGMEEPTIDENE